MSKNKPDAAGLISLPVAVAEAQRLGLDCTYRALYQAAVNGVLAATRRGSRIFVTQAALAAFVAAESAKMGGGAPRPSPKKRRSGAAAPALGASRVGGRRSGADHAAVG